MARLPRHGLSEVIAPRDSERLPTFLLKYRAKPAIVPLFAKLKPYLHKMYRQPPPSKLTGTSVFPRPHRMASATILRTTHDVAIALDRWVAQPRIPQLIENNSATP